MAPLGEEKRDKIDYEKPKPVIKVSVTPNSPATGSPSSSKKDMQRIIEEAEPPDMPHKKPLERDLNPIE